MEQSRKVGRIYAGALFEIARETNRIGEIARELDELEKLYDENLEFRRFFTSPRIERKQKLSVVREMFKGKVSDTVLNLLSVLVVKGRETALDNVVDAFQRYRDEADDRVHVYVRSAKPLSDDQRKRISDMAMKHAKSIDMHETVDADLIGGVIIRMHDFLVDTTLRTRLRGLRHELQPHAGWFY
ncbi:MAG: ATP synthase F1 subunit delta [Planctomycetota bacterium]